jgi:kynurenine formamidase
MMNFLDLTMPLNHRWMPDEGLPTAVKFFLGPKDHEEKGMVVGSDSGTSLTLPSTFAEFRKTIRLDQVPVGKLFLRQAVVAHIDKRDEKEISKSDAKGDAFLLITGWGDKPHPHGAGNEYILGSPHFSFDAARTLAQALHDNENDLLLTDTAVLGLPKAHIIPEWFSMVPAPSAESAEARMYLHLYDSDKTKKDFAVELEFAGAGITTVRKLVECGRIKNQRVKLMVSPLNIVRGVASTCRVVAVEE